MNYTYNYAFRCLLQITPYMHTLVYHMPTFLDKYQNVLQFSCQGSYSYSYKLASYVHKFGSMNTIHGKFWRGKIGEFGESWAIRQNIHTYKSSYLPYKCSLFANIFFTSFYLCGSPKFSHVRYANLVQICLN